MDYQEARAFYESRKQYGSRPGLASICALLSALGFSEEKLPHVFTPATGVGSRTDAVRAVPAVIQIAGTNGKGAVCTFMEQMLLEEGYHVGCFRSPAVFCERETITIDGRMISEADYAAYMMRLAACIAQLDKQGIFVTAFEAETALALMYFQEASCDFVLLEAGMGGALDATNVLKDNLMAVLTPISLDHTAVLGKTLGEIAAQKAGIARPHGVLVSAQQPQEAKAVLAAVCSEKKIKLIFCGEEIQTIKDAPCADKQAKADIPHADKLCADFQKENAALAACAVRALRTYGIAISEKAIADGIAHTHWHGRFEQIGTHPDFWIDGAHNPAAAARLVEAVQARCKKQKPILIIGMFRDKDTAAVCRIFSAIADRVLAVPLAPPRGLSAQEMKAIAEQNMPGVCVTACESAEAAKKTALSLAGEDGCVLAAGSLSYLRAFH